MRLWNALLIISLILLVGIIVVLIVFRFRKNYYYVAFSKDTLLKTTDDMGIKNHIYSTHGQTAEYIKKYIIRKSVHDDSLVCNFTRGYDEIQYYVIQYNKREKPINVKHIIENNTNHSSKIIVLKKNCMYVNIVIKRVDGLDINTRVIMPISMKNIRWYSLCASAAIFTSSLAISISIAKIVCGIYAKAFLNSPYHLIGVGAILIFAVVYYFISVLNLRRKNSKLRNGGALEYEFF